MPMDLSGKSDPYCVFQFGEPGKNLEKQQSNYIEQDLNPVWNEVFTFDVQTG